MADVEELLNNLENNLEKFTHGEDLREYLTTMSNFHQYSWRNTMLIMMQTKGEATYVNSFTGWKKIDRYVEKGAESIKIIAPAPYKKEKEVEKIDPTTKQVIRKSDGSAETEKKEVIIPAFKEVSVFDISQTAGKELPTITHIIDGTAESYEKLIKTIEEISPVPVFYEKIPGTANGYYSPIEKKIVVDKDLPDNHKIHTLLHEIAHATLDLSGEDMKNNREKKEVEAESIAYVSMLHLLKGQLSEEDIGQYSFGYIYGWSSDDGYKEFKEALNVIQKTANTIITNVENRLYSMEEKEVSQEKESVKEVPVINQSCGLHL